MFCLEDKLNWLYIDINSYFATIEQQVNAELRHKPIIVVPMIADSTSAIAASYEAKNCGITTGIKVYKAKQLCPDLICIQANHNLYVEYHHKIFQEVDKHLKVDHIFSIDEGACRLTGIYCKPEKALLIAEKIRNKILENVGEYINCSIGIAPNRYLAKIASNIQKPRGLILLNPSDLPHKLHDLRLSDLPGIGSKTQNKLLQNNITSIRQLLSLDQNHIKALWGSIWGQKIWYLLRGKDLPIEQVKNYGMSHSQVLSPDDINIENAQIIFTNLVLKLASRLRSKSLYTNNIYVEIVMPSGRNIHKSTKIHTVCDNQTLLEVARKSWGYLIKHYSVTKCKKITISFHNLQEEPKQMLLGDINQQKPKTVLSHIIDRLNTRYNKELVKVGIPLNLITNKPVIAFSHVPTADDK